MVGNQAGRDGTHCGVRHDDAGIGVEQRWDRLEPDHIGIGVGLCRDGVLAVEEGADAGIETAELGHSIGAGPMPEAAGVIGEAREPLARGEIEFGAVVRDARRQLGRASCRERVCQYVEFSRDAVSLKTKQSTRSYSTSTFSTYSSSHTL